LNRLAAVAPAWVPTHLPPVWLERDGARVENDRLPKTEAARQPRAATLGADGVALLQVVYAAEPPPEGRPKPAVEVLRRRWVQPSSGPDHPPRWRHDGDVPPPRLLQSPDELAARYRRRRGMAWIGDQVQMTETGDEDTPHGITQVATTLATTPDAKLLETIHAARAEPARLPHAQLVDGGDTDAEIRVGSEQADAVTIVGPVAADPSGQAREATGVAQRAFTSAWEPPTATCPPGKQRRQGQPDTDVAGQDVLHLRFAKHDCQACAVRAACRRANTDPRTRTVRTQGDPEGLQAARQRPRTVECKDQSAPRAGIAGTLSQGGRLASSTRPWRGENASPAPPECRRHHPGAGRRVVDRSRPTAAKCRTLCGVGVRCIGVRQQSLHLCHQPQSRCARRLTTRRLVGCYGTTTSGGSRRPVTGTPPSFIGGFTSSVQFLQQPLRINT
jgi:transposase